MKKNLLLTLTLLFLLAISSVAYAEPTSYGDVTFVGNVPSDLKDVSIIFEIVNKTTGTKTGVELSYLNGYKTNFMAEFGDYELVPQNTKVLSSDNKTLDCNVSIVPFTVGTNNPNGDWTWIINVDITKNFADNETGEKDEIKDAINDYLSDENKEETVTQNNNDKNISSVLIIPSDNKYFPNMTLKQIKDWYISEVEKFIATGNANYTLEEYKENVVRWANYSFKDKKNQMKTKYQALVEKYNKEETKDFYEVQKKMYDFIKEYQEETGVYLNFEKWDDIELEKEPSTNTETELEDKKEPSTNTETEPTIKDETTSQNNSENKQELATSEPKNDDTKDDTTEKSENNYLIFIIGAVVLLSAIAIVVIIFKSKSKNK